MSGITRADLDALQRSLTMVVHALHDDRAALLEQVRSLTHEECADSLAWLAMYLGNGFRDQGDVQGTEAQLRHLIHQLAASSPEDYRGGL